MSNEETNGNDWRQRMDRVERALDRLTERHEALAQSMELAHLDWEERWKKVGGALGKIGGALERDASHSGARSGNRRAGRREREVP